MSLSGLAALQVDLISGGPLSVKKEEFKRVQSYTNLLASQRDYTVAVYKYMLTLGPMCQHGSAQLL